ncbi:MAG: site-specific integrase [Fibrella sp.]|nr:site-specific integrase [Armatimonadota bacterium]
MFTTVQTREWESAITDFLIHIEANRAKNTRVFYASQLAALRSWAESEGSGRPGTLFSEYRVRNAPIPARPMPTDEDVRKLVEALGDFWDPRKNPGARRMRPERRAFHKARNTAIFLGLLDTACRIGEMLEMRLDDYKVDERRVLVRESKGRQPRPLVGGLPDDTIYQSASGYGFVNRICLL